MQCGCADAVDQMLELSAYATRESRSAVAFQASRCDRVVKNVLDLVLRASGATSTEVCRPALANSQWNLARQRSAASCGFGNVSRLSASLRSIHAKSFSTLRFKVPGRPRLMVA